jgi:hypothetical protein
MKLSIKGNFKTADFTVEIDTDETLASLVAIFLNSNIAPEARKAAYEAIDALTDNICPLDPDYNEWVTADKTQAFEELYPETVVIDNSPSPELQPETNCNTHGVVDLEDNLAVDLKEPGSVVWEQYKNTVLTPLLEKTLAEAKTKAAQKLVEPKVRELRKCLGIGLSDKFDEDFLEQMYLAKVKTFGNKLPETEFPPKSELQPETNCNTPEVKPEEDNPVVETIYVLKENAYLIEGKEPSSYTIIDKVLDIPDKSCQYLDENGELGEAVYAMAQARKDIRDGKRAFRRSTEAENAALLKAKLASIGANTEYSAEEKRNRSRNAKAMYSITDFSKV